MNGDVPTVHGGDAVPGAGCVSHTSIPNITAVMDGDTMETKCATYPFVVWGVGMVARVSAPTNVHVQQVIKEPIAEQCLLVPICNLAILDFVTAMVTVFVPTVSLIPVQHA